MSRASSRVRMTPRQENRRSRWMGTEAAFLKVRALILLPEQRSSTRSEGAVSASPVGVEQLLNACRKSGLKSKG